MAAYTFDGPNALIILPLGVTAISINDLWSRWIDWTLTGDNSKYLPAFRTSGGDPIGGGQFAGTYFFLENQAGSGWRIRPSEENQQLTITGNLFAEDSASPIFVPTLGGYTVLVNTNTSALTQLQGETISTSPMEELAQGTPSATPTFYEALMLLYMSARNRLTTTASSLQIHDSSGTVVAKSALTDDGTTFIRDVFVSGP